MRAAVRVRRRVGIGRQLEDFAPELAQVDFGMRVVRRKVMSAHRLGKRLAWRDGWIESASADRRAHWRIGLRVVADSAGWGDEQRAIEIEDDRTDLRTCRTQEVERRVVEATIEQTLWIDERRCAGFGLDQFPVDADRGIGVARGRPGFELLRIGIGSALCEGIGEPIDEWHASAVAFGQRDGLRPAIGESPQDGFLERFGQVAEVDPSVAPESLEGFVDFGCGEGPDPQAVVVCERTPQRGMQ